MSQLPRYRTSDCFLMKQKNTVPIIQQCCLFNVSANDFFSWYIPVAAIVQTLRTMSRRRVTSSIKSWQFKQGSGWMKHACRQSKIEIPSNSISAFCLEAGFQTLLTNLLSQTRVSPLWFQTKREMSSHTSSWTLCALYTRESVSSSSFLHFHLSCFYVSPPLPRNFPKCVPI